MRKNSSDYREKVLGPGRKAAVSRARHDLIPDVETVMHQRLDQQKKAPVSRLIASA